MITVEDYAGIPVDNGLVPNLSETSAFARASRRTALSLNGAAATSVTGIESDGYGEGQTKVAKGKAEKVLISANKSALIVVMTHEAWLRQAGLVDFIYDEAPTAHAVSLDRIIAGAKAVPAEWTNISTFGTGTTNLEYTDEDLEAQLWEAVEATGGEATAVVDSRFFSKLRGSRTGNAKTFVIEKVGPRTFDVDGIRVEVYRGTAGQAVVGDFARRAWYGEAEEYIRGVETSGIIDDSEGVTHNLFADNKAAVKDEVFNGFAVQGKASNFRKLVPAA